MIGVAGGRVGFQFLIRGTSQSLEATFVLVSRVAVVERVICTHSLTNLYIPTFENWILNRENRVGIIVIRV